MEKLIACCGLDCEACDAYLATVNDDGALREKTAKLWAKLNGAPITPEMINCLGCRAEGPKTPYCESMCEIRKCAAKNGFATCGECAKLGNCAAVGAILDNSDAARQNLLAGRE